MKQHQPPKLAKKLFEWYCGQAKVDDLLGDLDEWFYLDQKTKPLFTARWHYWKRVLALIFSYAIKKRKHEAKVSAFAVTSFSPAILNNYFKVAARSLYKHRFFSIVNIVGLSIGMCVSLLFITLYVYVCTFDNFHENKSNIYRIITSHDDNARSWNLASAPVSLAEDLDQGFAGIANTVRINSSFSAEAVSGNLNIPLRGFYTEPSFLSVFTYSLVKGNAATCLIRPNSMLLSESTALKIFNSTDVLGKTLEIKDRGNFEVTGIMAEPAKNSHMAFEVLVSYSTLPADEQVYRGNFRDWSAYGRQFVYLLLENRAVIPALEKHLGNLSAEASKRADVKIHFHLQALTEITPGKELTSLTGGLGPQWDSLGFIVFGVVCLLILLPACFNYTNISIARTLKRSKEIGLRKTVGGLKNQIFFQFITETVLITLISLLGALLLFYVMRSEFKGMLVSGAALDLSLTWQTALAFLIFALATGFVAGSFPAFHFAGLNPIEALKSQSAKRSSKNRVRKGLTIFQFALSFCFILALVVFSRQYRYSLNYDLGFQQAGILDVYLQGADPGQFRDKFEKITSVKDISMSSDVLGLSFHQALVNSVASQDSFEVAYIFCDHNYIKNLGMKFLAGKNFPNEIFQREKYIVINEQFVKRYKLGTPHDALGKLFMVEGKELEVIGVLRDFHFGRLNRPIDAFFLRMDPAQFSIANLNVSFTDPYGSLSQMEELWKPLDPDSKFEARFFDDEIRDAYDSYEVLLKLVGFLGLLAISISLLGLLGMVTYTSEIKTKEVGIRKVMGASTLSITVLLSSDYLKLMLWAAALAIPAATFMTDKILSNMQYYHVTLNFWDIGLSLSILMIMGLATIASQTFKTASTNPAQTLRSE